MFKKRYLSEYVDIWSISVSAETKPHLQKPNIKNAKKICSKKIYIKSQKTLETAPPTR